jgi:hypothetical protein
VTIEPRRRGLNRHFLFDFENAKHCTPESPAPTLLIRLTEIVDAIGELIDKVWYNRHQVTREKIEDGETKIVEKEIFPVKDHARRPIQRDVWEGALKSAAKVEKKYGLKNLSPWDDLDWGMMNGKLSALRWVLGEEWDSLYPRKGPAHDSIVTEVIVLPLGVQN